MTNQLPTGYLHPAYAHSLAEFGTPVELPLSRGWLLRRDIPGTLHCDAMGCYPLFACLDWQHLPHDLEAIESALVSVTLVTDPFGNHDDELLKRCFPDLLRPFKDHHVVDMRQRLTRRISENHQRNVRKALTVLDVRQCTAPSADLDTWVALYNHLIQVRRIQGLRRFSHRSFASQLAVPGIVAFQARHADATVGMILWYVQHDIAYYHLAAYSPAGYDLRASFALIWRSLEYFAELGLRWVDLGAGAGLQSNEDGLTRFKRGWATGTRPVYLCGRILNRPAYDDLVRARHAGPTSYFPAYRLGEFN